MSTFTTNIGLEQPINGADVNSWDVPVNADWALIDQALGSSTTQAFTNVNVTLTVAQAAYFQVICTGTLSGNVNLIFPAAIGGRRIIQNNCTGAFSLRVLNGAGDTGGGVTIPAAVLTPVLLTGGQALYDNFGQIRAGFAFIASAATTDLGSVPFGSLSLTGSATVTSFGSGAQVGESKLLTFAASIVLTNSANLILTGAANITTAAGDTAVATYFAVGFWRVAYQRASGLPVVAPTVVTSFIGRTGSVVAANNDYSTALLSTATTGTAPAAGDLGETLSATGTSVSVGTSPQTNVCSVVVTAGHWLCYAQLSIVNASQATTSYGGSISLSTGALGAGAHQFGGISIPAANTLAFAPPNLLVRTTGTTVFLGAYNGSTGGATATGTLTCLRVD